MEHGHYRSQEPDRSILVWICLMVAVVLACASAIARAEPRDAIGDAGSTATAYKADKTDTEHLVWAARICYLEATWRESDCVAMLWVATKRAQRVGRFWLDVVRRYSAIDAHNPRAAEVRTYPWGDVPGKPEPFNQRWLRLRELVSEFADGRHSDPCPRAEHWGGSMDHARGRMIPARCAASTANTFYAVKKR